MCVVYFYYFSSCSDNYALYSSPFKEWEVSEVLLVSRLQILWCICFVSSVSFLLPSCCRLSCSSLLLFSCTSFAVMHNSYHKRRTFHITWRCQTFQQKPCSFILMTTISHVKGLHISSYVVSWWKHYKTRISICRYDSEELAVFRLLIYLACYTSALKISCLVSKLLWFMHCENNCGSGQPHGCWKTQIPTLLEGVTSWGSEGWFLSTQISAESHFWLLFLRLYWSRGGMMFDRLDLLNAGWYQSFYVWY